jgi:hypothetical protein
MPAPPTDIQKGPILEKIDSLSANATRRDAFLQQLQDPKQDYVDILLSFGVVDKQEADHLRQHWFPQNPQDTNAWWPQFQPIEPLLRAKMIEAFEQARDYNLSVDAYWISIGTRVEVFVQRSEKQITLLRVTPKPSGT